MITPNSKPSNLRRKKKTMPQAQNKHKKAARAQIIKNRYQHLTITKRITSQQAAIAQKR
ncbi:hypothetical protein LNQ52_03630 [Klebsiella pneumoniae subsp. pneumoniae]|nr:hypothetical protein [Klebsiella pneumoniae subsp. pneumoniae]